MKVLPVTIEMPVRVPAMLMRTFMKHIRSRRKRCDAFSKHWGWSDEDAIEQSVRYLSRDPDNPVEFNCHIYRPGTGVKGKLAKVRGALAIGAKFKTYVLRLRPDFFRTVLANAEAGKVTVEEHILICMSYHAGISAEAAKRKSTPIPISLNPIHER